MIGSGPGILSSFPDRGLAKSEHTDSGLRHTDGTGHADRQKFTAGTRQFDGLARCDEPEEDPATAARAMQSPTPDRHPRPRAWGGLAPTGQAWAEPGRNPERSCPFKALAVGSSVAATA